MCNYPVVYAQEKGKETAYLGMKEEITPGSKAFLINPFMSIDSRTLQSSGWHVSPPYIMPDTHESFTVRTIGYRLTPRLLDLELAALKTLKETYRLTVVEQRKVNASVLRDSLVQKKMLALHQVNLGLSEARNAGYIQEKRLLGRVIGSVAIAPEFDSLAEKLYRLETE